MCAWQNYRTLALGLDIQSRVSTNNMASRGWGPQDVPNQYVAAAVKGGLVTLFLFIALLGVGFAQLRLARGSLERAAGPKSLWALFAWGDSVSLAAHCASFVSVSCLGQMFQFFVFFVATIPTFTRVRRPKPVKSPPASPSASAPRSIATTRLRQG